MSAAALFPVLDALVSRFTTTLAAEPTVVFDGPDVRQPTALESVTVGANDATQDTHSGFEQQNWGNIGATRKDALGTVDCYLVTQSGTTDASALRTRAAVLLGLLETALRANIDLGGAALYSGLGSIDLRQQETADGAVTRVAFTITYRARI